MAVTITKVTMKPKQGRKPTKKDLELLKEIDSMFKKYGA